MQFSGDHFQVVLFHYDNTVDKWRQYDWFQRVLHIQSEGQGKWWFAKRFLHPDVVAPYEYIFIWDEDLNVKNCDPHKSVPALPLSHLLRASLNLAVLLVCWLMFAANLRGNRCVFTCLLTTNHALVQIHWRDEEEWAANRATRTWGSFTLAGDETCKASSKRDRDTPSHFHGKIKRPAVLEYQHHSPSMCRVCQRN